MPEPDRRAWPLVAGEPNVTDAYLVVTETEFEQAAASTRLAVSLHDLQGPNRFLTVRMVGVLPVGRGAAPPPPG